VIKGDLAESLRERERLRDPALNFEVGEGFAKPDLGRTRLVDRPGRRLAGRRVGQSETLA
jgi:hypothetical protein